MGAYSGPELVDDGLVLALDAANTRSYGGSGTTWTDVSYNGNNGTLTNGPVFTQEPSLEPFGGAGAVSFDGTGDYLSVADDASLQLGSGDFTIEFWIYLNSLSGNPTPIDKAYTGSGVSGVGYLLQYSSSALKFYGGITLTSSTTDTTSVWIHYALVRNSGTTTLYRNGVSVASGSDNTNYTYNTSLGIGANILAGAGFGAGAGAINGYISNLRVLKGTALYTSNFTPKRQPLIPESAPNTVLLTCQKGNIRDRSPSAHTITINGDAKSISGASYFKFDGTNDYVTIPDTINFTLGSSNFTLECWVYFKSTNLQVFLGQNDGNESNASIDLRYNNSFITAYAFYGNSNVSVSSAASLNTWHYVAWVRDGSTMRLFINGTQVGTANISTNTINDSSTNFEVGSAAGGNYVVNGNISNVRIYKGKGLTAAEVLQNYQNTKSRYGL